MPIGKPLDVNLLDDGDVEEDLQLEIIPERNEKFSDHSDYDLEEDLKKHRCYLRTLTLKDTSKLQIQIDAIERELLYRKSQAALGSKQEANVAVKVVALNGDNSRQRYTHATTARTKNVREFYSKTDCSGRRSKGQAPDGAAFSEELEILNPSNGKGRFAQFLSNTEGSTLGGANDKSRIYSGDLAGPSPRQGLRSSSKQCNRCNKRFPPTKALVIGDGEDCDLFCSTCQMQSKSSYYSAAKESTKGICPSGRKGNVGKRARQGGVGGESPEKVVELFSSEDEGDKEAQETSAECKTSNQKKGYGTRSTLVPSMEGVKIAYPSRDDPEAVEVIYHDLHRLEPLEFLNDTVIDFYIKYMQRPEVLTVEHKNKFYFFNSFFYKKLSEVVSGQNKKNVADLSKLRKWTKGTNIFEKEYLFVPIHDKWHWSLAIVCHPGATSEDTGSQRCILHLDSMSPGHKSNNVFRLLRTYLLAEWEHQAHVDGIGNCYLKLSHEDFIVKKIVVPQQENESDCGLFLLHYIECFLKEAPSSIKLSDIDQGKLFGRNWFKPSRASGLRRDIQQLLEAFFQKEAANVIGNAETIEKLSSQSHEPESLIQVQHINHSRVDDETISEVVESVNCPGQFSATEPLHQNDMPAPKVCQVKHGEQFLDNNVLRIDEDKKGCSCASSAGAENYSGLPAVPKLRFPAEFQSCGDLGVSNKHQRVGSADDNKGMFVLNRLNSLPRKSGDDQSELRLVVELPLQEEQFSVTKVSQLDCGVLSDDTGEQRVLDVGQADKVKMDCSG